MAGLHDEPQTQTLAESIAEFNRQRAVDPVTADRTLLETGLQRLRHHLQEETLEPQVAHAGYALLHRRGDYAAVVDLLSRYLTQPLSVSEEAWARWLRTDILASSRRNGEAVASQEAFLAWARGVLRILCG